jgi:hypothetical protein
MISRAYQWDLLARIRAALRDQRGVLNSGSALNPTNLVDKVGDDTLTGHYSLTKPLGTAGAYNFVDNLGLGYPLICQVDSQSFVEENP